MHELKDVRYKTYLVEITANVKINILLFFTTLESRTEKPGIYTYMYVCLFAARTEHYFNHDSRII